MSTYYLINSVRLGTQRLSPSALINSAFDDVAGIQANGGLLIASSDTTIAAAAAIAQQLVVRGNINEAAGVMLAAATKSAAGDDLVSNLASTATGKGASTIGIFDDAALFTATDVEGALAEVKVIADAAVGVAKRTVTVGHADLTDAVNGEAQSINIGATLPANARIAYCDVRALTPFSGGSASAVSLMVGTSGDLDAIIASSDLFAAAVDGGPSTLVRGIRPNKLFATIGAQLLATFTPDGGHTLLGLTAGSVIVDVFYFVAA